MFILQVLGALLMISTSSMSRGPHHPRGETVVKHHVHYRPTKEHGEHEKLTQDSQLLHDREHIREDLGEWMQEKEIDEMTDEELEFHYFNLHDSDKNSHLDGLEILQAMRHTVEHEHPEHDDDSEEHAEEDPSDFDFFVEMIDEVLLEDDTDSDGFISYPEYVAAKKKEVHSKAINDLLIAPRIS